MTTILLRLLAPATVLLAAATLSLSSGAAVVVRYITCDPIGRTEVCADANEVPIQAFSNNANGTLFAGGYANATYLRAYVDNGAGGSARVTSTYSDIYTLVGPGSAPITLTANLWLHGTVDYDPAVNSWSFAAGFMNSGGSYFAAPASLLVTSGPGVAQGAYARVLSRDLMLAPGDSIALSFQLDLLANHVGAELDFFNTLTLGFSGLPDGYFMDSRTGFNGVGSRPGTTGNVPEPGTLLLSLAAGLAALRLSRRRTRRACAIDTDS